MSNSSTSASVGSKPAAKAIQSLEDQVAKLGWSIDRQLDALNRLKSAVSSRDTGQLDKLVCETTTYLLMFQALQEQITKNVAEVAPNVELSQSTPGPSVLPIEDRIDALSRSAAALNSSLAIKDVLYQAMQTLSRHTGAERAFLLLTDEATGKLKFEVSQNIEEQTVNGSAFAVSRTIVNTVMEHGEPIITTNAAADPRFCEEHSIAIHSLRSIVCVPLKAKERVIGVIYADHRVNTSQFSTTDVSFLAAYANQASTAIQNARLFEKVTVARNLMRNVFESMSGGVITTDMQGVVTMCNSAAEQILKINSADCVNMPSTLVLPVLEGVIPDLVDMVLSDHTQSYSRQVEGYVAGRGSVSVNLTASPLKEDDTDSLLGVVILLDDQTERMRFERERGLVKRYLPAQLVDSLADLGELQLGGARGVVSIFFADIRGFTSFSERHDPRRIVDVINTYFGIASDLIHANHGIVDKYMGDAVMAHYNSPLSPVKDHAWFAVKTAWETRLQIEEFLKDNSYGSVLEFGIGVNTGEALAGNVGASSRMEYTLIGDAVNVAKRLQESAGPGQILLGEDTYSLVAERVEVVPAGATRLKGRQGDLQVFELVGLRS